MKATYLGQARHQRIIILFFFIYDFNEYLHSSEHTQRFADMIASYVDITLFFSEDDK